MPLNHNAWTPPTSKLCSEPRVQLSHVDLLHLQALPEPQWLNCDVRSFDMSVLGKFGVIMTDPPWEIHQDLPYGTMADNEMRKLDIGTLQDDGVIFVWVTGEFQADCEL